MRLGLIFADSHVVLHMCKCSDSHIKCSYENQTRKEMLYVYVFKVFEMKPAACALVLHCSNLFQH